MAASSEIEKLERRYAENPDGRYFAPLADAYRKAGQLDRALELVRAGLTKHPDYLSAHIVLGRCLLDHKDDGSAAQAFQRVLSLDAENIIALKSLAEIFERKGELLQSREWLSQLLKIDPMNADAEADLQRLGGAIGGMTTAQVPAVVAVPEAPASGVSFADVQVREPGILSAHPPEAPPTAAEGPSLVRPSVGIVPSQFAPPQEEVPGQPLEVKPFDDALAWGTGERSSRAVSQKDLEEALHEHEASLAAPSETVAPTDETTHVVAEPVSTQESWMGGPTDDAWSGRASLKTRVVDADSITIAAGPDQEFDIPEERPPEGAPEPVAATEPEGPPEVAAPRRATVPWWEAAAEWEAVPEREAPGAPEAAPEAEAAPEPAEVPEPVAEVAADARMSLANLPIIMPEDVTPPDEMARPSGKHGQAASPEPEPAVPSGAAAPEPDRAPLLTETMGDLYLQQGFRAEAADVYRRLLVQRPGDAGLEAKLAAVEAPAPAFSAAALGTESSRSWLRRVAQSRVGEPTPAPGAPPEGPSPLEQAFAQPEATPGRPSEPAGEPARPASEAFTLDAIFGATGAAPAAPPTPPPPTGTSFDEFFGAPPEQGTVRPESGTAPASPPPDDDVGSFTNWLRGLKR
jgi:tetratricopeptide (TPR) repeat protein